MNIIAILNWLRSHHNIVTKAILIAFAALFLYGSINIYKKNKELSNQLEMVNNNILAYLGIINGSLLANNVLKIDMSKLQLYNDSLINKLDSVSKKLNIKPKLINTAATQTLTIYVTQSKGVRGLDNDLVLILTKDSVYKDTMLYNDLTKVYYTIGKDTVDVTIDLKNTQYLYVYKKKLYKNKKNFLKRLFTLDFKKITVYKYDILNTNDLLKTTDVRVIESTEK